MQKEVIERISRGVTGRPVKNVRGLARKIFKRIGKSRGR
jgi:hypothetical protein